MSKKIEVFIRHCFNSKTRILSDKERPSWFTKAKTFENFKNTLNNKIANYTVIYDEYYGDIKSTFLRDEENVEIVKCGNEPDSFLKTLDYVKNKNFSDNTIVYFLEDDYIHKPNWCEVLLEGFSIKNAFYVTLYDFDFYLNKDLMSRIFSTKTTHWRSVPATTNTFSTTYKNLIDDYEIHRIYSSEIVDGHGSSKYSRDYEKFWKLLECEKGLISPIPGYSTHCEKYHLSPFVDWENVIFSSTNQLKVHQKNTNFLYT